MFRTGKTQAEIGDTLSLTRQRIQQILKHNGLTRQFGGSTLRKAAKAAVYEDGVNRRYLSRWGITRSDANSIISIYGNRPFRAFLQQRKNARFRKIPFEFTFRQWWELWQASGKFDDRGTMGGEYVMSRIGDVGPYSEKNVEIKTATANHKEWRKPPL